MTISPPSDIILDVVRAADPQRMRAATERLVQFAGDRGPGAASFASFLDGARRERIVERPFDPATARVVMHNREALAASGLRERMSPAEPYRQFEAFVLQSFVETMLPKDAESVFGSGTAGEVWKGMLAEKIGAELAASGGIGIAEQLAKLHPENASPANPAPADPAPQAGLEEPFASARSTAFFNTFWQSGG
jgi:peptidoglycan hydrolase FlgJ